MARATMRPHRGFRLMRELLSEVNEAAGRQRRVRTEAYAKRTCRLRVRKPAINDAWMSKRGSPRSKHECYARTFCNSHQHALVGRFRTDDVGLGGAIHLGQTVVVIARALVTWEVHQGKTGHMIPADPPTPTQWMPTRQSDHDRFPADVDPPQIARVFEGRQHEGD